jgi:hypothetical protein
MATQIQFIDRETELTLIAQAIRAKNTRRIIGIQADGGVGKTRLLQEVQQLYRDTDIGRELGLLVTDILDFDDRTNHIPQNVGRRIAQMLGIQFFKSYLRGLREYQMLEQADVHYARLQEAKTLNNQSFIECFNTVTRKQRVVLLLDTTEKFITNTNYLLDWMEKSENAVWILVGRQNSEVLQWICAKQCDEFQFLELRDLSSEASEKYLQTKQRSLSITVDSSMAEKLLILAQGRPILIDLAVEWFARSIPMEWLIQAEAPLLEELSDEKREELRQTFERQLVLSVADMRRRIDRLILATALVHPLDAAILGKLLSLSPTKAQALFQEAQQYVFIKQLPDGRITLHDEMRRMVQAYVWPEVDPDNDRRYEYSKIAVEYFADQEKSLKVQIKELKALLQGPHSLQSSLENEESELINSLRRQTLERELWVVQESLLYHSLIVDIGEGVDVFARLFDEATDTYTFERREIFCARMQPYNFDGISTEHKYKLYSRNLINNPGETNSRRRHLPKMPNTGTLRNLC